MRTLTTERIIVRLTLGVWVLLLVMVLGERFQLSAQTTYSSIVGSVVDPSGAAIPNVAIAVTNDATNIKSTAETDQHGNYLVDKLIAGQYTVTAERAAFTACRRERAPTMAST
jgi:hypothetical protein